MSFVVLTLHGASVNITGEYPNITDVALLTDYANQSFNLEVVHGKPVFEFNETIYLNNYKEVKKKARLQFNPVVEFYEYPTASTNIESFYDISLLNLPFHWISFSDYKMAPVSMSTGKCMAVNMLSYDIEENDQLGIKKVSFQFETRFTI